MIHFENDEQKYRYKEHYRQLVLNTACEMQENKYPGENSLYMLCRLKALKGFCGYSATAVQLMHMRLRHAIEMLVKEGELSRKSRYWFVVGEYRLADKSNVTLSEKRNFYEFRLLFHNKVYAPFSKELRETRVVFERECIEKHLLTPEIIGRYEKFKALLPEGHDYSKIFKQLVSCIPVYHEGEEFRFEEVAGLSREFGVEKPVKITKELEDALLEICEIDRDEFEMKMSGEQNDDTVLQFVVKIILYSFMCGTPLVLCLSEYKLLKERKERQE